MRLAGFCFLIATTAGCLGGFKTPSEYQSQTYYCTSDNAPAFDALAQSCQSSGNCFGAFSMTGSMQGQPLTVGTTLTEATMALVQKDPSSPQFWDVMRMTGNSPYFEFVFHIKSIGGDVTAMQPRTLDLRAGAGALVTSLDDTFIDVGQTLQVGGANAEQQGLTDSGTIAFSKMDLTEIRGIFHGAFGNSVDNVDGCFVMYPGQTTINPSPSP
ncbi:MAG TPA: hypothetical protein VN947_35035 [Polyangia bacterium]|nr:hypothetical protein [Polyangia bacterium]